MKICFKCFKEKEISEFHKHKGMKNGHLNKCAMCVQENVAKWRTENPEARKKEHARIRERVGFMTRKDYLEKRKRNQIGRQASSLKYIHKRRSLTEQVAQTELDEFVFEEAYRLSRTRETTTGIKWHIDHIVPLMHKQACGLNNAFNLQVVPAKWNVTKGNRNMNTYFSVSGY
jgi:hypothetical protein